MRTYKLIISSALALALVTSCTRAIMLDVFNNTGVTVRVLTGDKGKNAQVEIPPAGSGRVKPIGPFTVASTLGTWIYEPKPVPKTKAYMLSESLGPLVVRAQLQRDGSLWVLPPQSSSAITTFPPQPEGYPLVPVSAPRNF